MPVLLDVIRAAKELHVEKDELLTAEHLPTLGVTDTAIIQLARRKEYLVVTDDFALYGHLETFGCDVVNLNHLRTQRWFG